MATRFNKLLRERGIMKGESKILREPGPHPRRHRPDDRRVDGGGEGAEGVTTSCSSPPLGGEAG